MDNFSMADVKKKNYGDIFRFLYSNAGSSKQAIVNELNISLPTVSQHLAQLLEDGLIEKCGQLGSSIGRKAVAYSVCPQARVAIGVELLQHEVALIALDLYGEMLAQITIQMEFSMTDAYYTALGHAVTEFTRLHHFSSEQVLGVGIGIQGLVGADGQEVVYGQILHCTGLRTASFQQKLPYPCMLIHDADCAAMSELWQSPEVQNAAFLSLSWHLGSAIIINGSIFTGKNGRSGTLEHMTLRGYGRECYCGHHDCAECYCSLKALLREGERLDEFMTRKALGDEEVIQRWNTFLENLSLLIHNTHMLLDGDVLLGGHLAAALTEEDLTVLQKRICQRTAFPQDYNYLLVGKCSSNVVCTGAALCYLKAYFAQLAPEGAV